MKIHHLISTFALCITLGGCSGLPTYSTNNTKTTSIRIQSTDGSGVTVIRKLSSACQDESTFQNAIGLNPRDIGVDADDHKFSFKLVFISPKLVGCEVTNTIDLDNKNAYRLLLETPPPGSPKNVMCKLRLEVANDSTLAQNNINWLPGAFTNQCAKNERF